MILVRNCCNVILTLYIFAEFAQLSGNAVIEIRLALWVVQIKLSLQHTNLEHERILRMVDTLLKCLFAQVLNKFIRVFIRSHIDDTPRHSCRMQNLNSSKRCFHTCPITIIRQ